MNENIHLNINLSARSIVGIIKSLFIEFDFDESEFVITIHDNDEQDEEETNENIILEALDG